MTFKIGVTGATGYVGRNIVREALKHGYEVHVFTRNPTQIDGAHEHHWEVNNSSVTENYAHLNLDALIHCAALADDNADLQESLRVNAQGTLQALQLGNAKRFVHMSTASVYLNEVNKTDLLPTLHTPNVHVGLQEPYVYSKMVAECSLHDAVNSGTHFFVNPENKVVILRPHIVYGGDDTTLLPKLLKVTKIFGRKAFICVPGGGKSVHSVTHIDTLTSAALFVATVPNTKLLSRVNTYNVSDKQPVVLAHKIQEVIRETTGVNKVFVINIPQRFAVKLAQWGNKLWIKGYLRKKPTVTEYAIKQLTENLTLNLEALTKLAST